MKHVIQIEVKAQVQWRVGQSDAGNWIGVCEPLKMTMEGSTLDELQQNIHQSIQLLMEDLMETGELDAFLRDHGWRAIPGPQQHGSVEFQVPYELLVRHPRDSARTLLQ
jgi:predicted RNase H-like HicB family nuclease